MKYLKSFLLLVTAFFITTVSFAQITTLSDWTNVYHGTSNSISVSYNGVTTGTNTNRVLVVAIATTRTAAGSRTITVSYGGQTLTSVNGDIASNTRQHTQLYYLNEAGLDAASNTTLSVTVSGGTTANNDVWAAVYDGVDQTSPVTDSKNYNSGTGTSSTPEFATALTINTNDLAIKVVSSVRTGSTSPRNINNFGPNWTIVGAEQTSSYDATGTTNDLGIKNAVGKRVVPRSTTTDVSTVTLNNATLASLTGLSLKYAPKYFRSASSGDWSSASTWEQSYNNSTWVSATSVPTSVDNLVTIQSDHTVSLTATATVSSVTVNGVLDVNTYTLTGTGTLTVASDATVLVGGTSNFPTGFATTTLNNGSTVNYDNIGNQTISAQSYSNLSLSGSGTKTLPAALTSIAGNLTLNSTSTTTATTAAALTIGGNLEVGSGATFATGATDTWTLSVGGTTTVDGTLTLANTGTKTFTGDVTLNNGGVWNETGAASINFEGSLTNNATTFTASTGTHTFSGASKTLSGSTTIAIPTVTFTGSYTNSGTLSSATLLTVTSPAVLTNNGTVIATTALSGTGGLTQGTTGVLNIGGTSGLTTITATAIGNTVNYTGAAQTAKVINYYNLTLSGSGAKTFATSPTVNGTLSLEGTANIVVTIGVVTYGPNATLQYNKPAAYTATSEEWISVFLGTGGIIIANSGAITMNAEKTLYTNVPLTINNGATLNTSATYSYPLSIGGDFTNNGTFIGNTSTVTMTRAGKTIGGTSATTFYALSINNTTYLATHVTVTSLTLTSGILYLGNYNLTHTGTLAVQGTPSVNNMIVTNGTGQFRKTYTAIGAYTFPVGDATGTLEYSPVTINVTAGSFSSAYIGVRAINEKHPNNGSTVNYLNRYWSITSSGITSLSANINATYVNADIVGERKYQVFGRYISSLPWTKYVTMDNTSLLAIANGVTQFGDFTGITVLTPTVSISANPSFSVGQNDPLSLTANPLGDAPFTYLWVPGGAVSQTISPSTASNGVTNYSVTVTDANGFTGTATVSITVSQIKVSQTTLSGLNYAVGHGPSDEQSFNVQASSLSANLVITAPANFEVSTTSGSGFGSSVTLTPIGGVINSTPIYVRLKAGLVLGYVAQNITLTSTGSTTVAVSCSGTVTPSVEAFGGGWYCAGSTIPLTSEISGTDNIYWTGPNDFYSLLQEPTLTSATAAMSGTYILTGSALSGNNLITNGTFSNGNTGFGSSYGYVVDGSATNELQPEGLYTVTLLPSTTHTNFNSVPDHTGVTSPPTIRNQMVVNGATVPGVVVWSQTVSVNKDVDYQYSYWIQTVVNGVDANPAQLQLFVNGVAAGPIKIANPTTGIWTQFIYNWNSSNYDTAVLTLVNQNTIAGGNDFALDDIVFQQVYSNSDTIEVEVNPVPAPPLAAPNQLFLPNKKVADILATLADPDAPGVIRWYTNPTGGTPLSPETNLTDGATYYAETYNGCVSSPRTPVTVTLRWEVTTIASNGSITRSLQGSASSLPNMFYYSNASSVTFTGVPSPEYALTAWKVNDELVTANLDGTLTLSISENKLVEAVFSKYVKYRSSSDGEWTSSVFSATADNISWFDAPSPIITTIPIEIRNEITISEEETITVNNLLVLDSPAKLINNGTLIINDTITLVINKDNVSQFVNEGDVENNGVVRLRRHYKKEEEWVFMSFPFDVAENHIFYAGTQTVPSWGGARDDGYIFYVAEYDGLNRDLLSTGLPNYTGIGVYWKDVSPKILKKRQGYIIAADNDLDIDFVSESSVNYMFESNATLPIHKYTTNSIPVHQSWNLIGLPYLSAFNLLGATQDFAPYYCYKYKTKGYEAIMPDESYVVDPYTSFFMQAWGAPNVVTYNSNNITLRAAKVVDYDEISMILSNQKYSDKTRIRLKNDGKDGYELGNDAVKLMSSAKQVPQVFTKTNGYNLAVNSLPKNTKKVDLGVYIGEKGTYNLKLIDTEKINKCSQVILIDNITGTQTDLLAENEGYAFDSDKVGTTNRFSLLLISEGTSAIEATEGQNILIQAIGDNLYVDGLDREATVLVYDLSGKLVQQFVNVHNNDALPLDNTGIYVVDVKNETQQGKAKISIKK